ncbi:MAG: alginate export family protein [Planctomycetia bacterium]|nr:alginate export family protein [Planctomycetia bacterium]
MMKHALWRTYLGSFLVAVFCVTTSAQSFGSEAVSLEDMERELNALRASVSALTDQIETVRQEKTVTASASDTKEDVESLKNEVNSLKEEMRVAAQADSALKAEDITGNVYSEFAKKVKLGGQIRTRAEYANGYYQVPTNNGTLPGAARPPDQSKAGHASSSVDDDYVLQQTRLWADADVNEHLRVFIQLQDARTFGAAGTTVGYANANTENSITDLHQGYFDIRKLFDMPLTARVGRQEIVWGDHRVIGNFVWSNVGRVFDAGRFMWDTDDIHAEVFAAKVDEDGFFGVDGSNNSDETAYAAQLAFKKLVPGALLELMYIQKNDQDASAGNSTLAATGYAGADNRPGIEIHDIGARIDGKIPNLEAIDYTFESHGQFGDYGDMSQRAWAFAGRAGYTFKDLAWKPRFGFEYDYASGDDDPTDSSHETFDNLYPTNHLQGNYGFVDLVSWQNMHDFRGNIKIVPTNKLTCQVDYHYFLLAEAEDGWYLANGSLATSRPLGGYETGSSNLAQEIDLTVSYQLYKNVGVLAGYSWFGAQSWINSNVESMDTNWGYIQTTVTF